MTRSGAPDPVRAAFRRCVPGMLLSIGVSSFLSVVLLTVPVYMMQVFDRVLGSRSTSTLFWLTAIALGALAVYAALDFARFRIHHALSQWLSRRLGLDALQATVLRSLRGKGSPAQALRDINDLRLFLASSAVTTAMEVLWSPLFFAVLFVMHPAYGIVSLIGALLLLVLGIVNEAATHRPLAAANEAGVRAYNAIGSALRNAEVIEAMGLMRHLLARWWRANEETLHLSEVGGGRAALITAISRALRLSVQLAMIATGVLLVLDKAASPGSIFAATIIMGRALGPFEHLIDSWRQWVFSWAAYGRVREVFEDTGEARSAMPLPRPHGPLEVDRLVFVPPSLGRAVLRGLSFRLEPGEVLGVLGPSAAGKSTLARLLVGVWKPTSGSICLDGHDVYLWERTSFGAYVGYLPQNVGLFDGTVRENIGRLGEADPLAVVEAAKRADVHDLVGRLPFGYDTEIGDGGFLLTGGQRQRLALARALFGSPRLLVLDEPDANLDQAGEAALVQAIEAAKREGAIVVVVSHRAGVLQTADKLMVLREGAIERFGQRREVTAALERAKVAALPARLAEGAPGPRSEAGGAA